MLRVHAVSRSAPRPSPIEAWGQAQRSGPKRRAFEAEMAWQSCAGNPLLADTIFGWGRHTGEGGARRATHGWTCLGAPSACRGRTRWADAPPEAAAALRQLAQAHAQPDPTLRTPLASPRRTAQVALEALRAQGDREDQRPSPSTRAAVLNRLGWRRRQVVHAKAQKKSAATDAMVATMAQKPPPR